ncbi:MAG: hypothetical protein QM651_07440, partial [Rhodoblastus sp.]
MLAARTLRDECGGVAPAVDSPCEAAPVNAVEIAPDLALPPDFAPVLLQAAPAAADARPGVALALSLALHVCVAAGVVGLAAHKLSSGPDDIEMIELVVEQASAAPDSKAETSAPQRPAPRHIAEPAVAPAPASAQERLDELATLPLPPPAPDAAEAIAQDTLRAQAEQRRAAQARAAETARRQAAHAREIERREEAAREKAERARIEAQRERRAEDTQARAERAQARADESRRRDPPLPIQPSGEQPSPETKSAKKSDRHRDPDPITVHLDEGFPYRVRVIDREGDPIPGAMVDAALTI